REPPRRPSPPACAPPSSACGRAAGRRGRRRPARQPAQGAVSRGDEPTAEHGEVNSDAGGPGLEACLAEPRELILDAVGLVHLPVDLDRPLLAGRRDDDVAEDEVAARLDYVGNAREQ